MGFLNRLILFLFAMIALIVGIVGWALFLRITSFEYLDSKIGNLGWIFLGVVWMIGAFRVLTLSITSFSSPKKVSEDRLVTKNTSGDMVLTAEVIHTMTQQALSDVEGIHNVTIRPFFQKGKLEITINLKTDGSRNLPELIKEIQSKVNQKLQSTTGIKPENVIVEVDQILPQPTTTLPDSSGTSGESKPE